MKIRNKDSAGEDKVELQMTPMIDIVFQLLVFFILTFNVVAQEGDFSIRMPALSKPAETLDQPEMTTIKVHMEAISSGEYAGELKRLKLNEETLFEGGGKVRTAFDTLHARILKKVDDAGGPASAANLLEVEFVCDYRLKYNNVIQAITAVSGKKVEGDKISRLIEKIKFAPPGKKGG